jgi:hypothetical protein
MHDFECAEQTLTRHERIQKIGTPMACSECSSAKTAMLQCKKQLGSGR